MKQTYKPMSEERGIPSPTFVSVKFIEEFERLKEENERLKKENKMFRKWTNKLQVENSVLEHKMEQVKGE